MTETARDPLPPPKSNVPELSVSALSLSLQRTLEDSFGRVRVRGEICNAKLASSGHLYAGLKDEDACLDIICWRSTVSRLKIKPEDGMDVVCTGKITSYPKSSRYQMIVESVELAGEGALLKMLEDRKKKLAAEGLFAPERKKPIPALPVIIGIVTSPTGAVIRDILHRLNDRFPRHVLVWPVAVQGPAAAAQIAAAIEGFNALTANRPDVLIVARGGGSLEDLMAFNEENVVRAAAASAIPLISAVGHETDTTLIDYAADLRAPTPTAAAEMAVPVRAELLGTVMLSGQRLYNAMTRNLRLTGQNLRTLEARLGDPSRIIALKTQGLDHASYRLGAGFEKLLAGKQAKVAERAARLRHPHAVIAEKTRILSLWDQRLAGLQDRLTAPLQQRLNHAWSMFEALSFKKVLERGFTVIRDENNKPVTSAGGALNGRPIDIEFHDGRKKGYFSD